MYPTFNSAPTSGLDRSGVPPQETRTPFPISRAQGRPYPAESYAGPPARVQYPGGHPGSTLGDPLITRSGGPAPGPQYGQPSQALPFSHPGIQALWEQPQLPHQPVAAAQHAYGPAGSNTAPHTAAVHGQAWNLRRRPLALMPAGPGMAASRQPYGFAHILVNPIPAGQEANAQVIADFNRGAVSPRKALRDTTSCIARLGRDWHAAVGCLQALNQSPRRIFPDSQAFTAAMAVCGRAGQGEKAQALFDQLVTHGAARGIRPDPAVYGTLMSTWERSDRPDKALEVFGRMPSDMLTTRMCTTAMRAYGQIGQAGVGLSLFDDLVTHGPAMHIFPDQVVYNVAISLYEKAGRADKAVALFMRMRDESPGRAILDPNSYNAVISACETGGLTDHIAELLCIGRDRVFNRSFGFNATTNVLDLFESAVLLRPSNPAQPNREVHPAVARAIFRGLLSNPGKLLGEGARGINRQTQFLVGQHRLKEVIAECMRQQGWNPVPPLAPNNRPNVGRLTAQPSGSEAAGGLQR